MVRSCRSCLCACWHCTFVYIRYIVDISRLSTDSVQIMSKVEMTNMANNAKMSYTIVSESEANLREGKISINTPIAKGLLNKKVGEIVEIKIPRGTIKLRIDKISFE